jgi:hypothetical protein
MPLNRKRDPAKEQSLARRPPALTLVFQLLHAYAVPNDGQLARP